METLLVGITVVSLALALVMGVALWRLLRDEKRRSAARVAALSVAAGAAEVPPSAIGFEPRVEWVPAVEPTDTHATGFLSASADGRDDGGNRQRALALASVILLLVLSGGLVWTMSGPRGTTAAATVPDAPLELTSLSHTRQNDKLAVSGLVRNPVSGKPVERLTAVVLLFDKTGTFVASSRAHVDFLTLGAGDETPFAVSLDAAPTVARYRVSFRTDEGVVPHIDKRSPSPVPAEGDQPVKVSRK